jgi:Na+/proline symporter
MQFIDWVVLCSAISFVVVYSIMKSRDRRNIHDYVLSGRDAQWYTVALSVMATQASAITFISTPGQAYTDGMRFVQFYFGLPFAMVILCVTVLPIYRRLNVLTAYEYLEKRFDLKTRSLAALLFLTQRSLAAGLTIYAPSIIVSLILGWNVNITILAIGMLVVLYTSFGGTKAVSWAQSYQMAIIFTGMTSAFIVIVWSLPSGVSFGDALHVAGASGKLNVLDFSFDLNNRYTFWSGLLGGLFLQLSYFGTDQSQVQRYLTGQSLTQSRLGLIFNGLFKIPMQFVILLLGAMMFVFYQFTPPPLFFNNAELQKLDGTPAKTAYQDIERRYSLLAEQHRRHTERFVSSLHTVNSTEHDAAKAAMQSSKQAIAELRAETLALLKQTVPNASTNDTNYIFLSFVIRYLPAGLVGLVIAAILSASMSSASSEMNALASTTIVDVYKRLLRPEKDPQQFPEDPHHYVTATRIATILWGLVIVLFAQFADRLGSLIEAVNILGSLFYGTILGIFLTAFYLKFVRGTAVFLAALVAECVVVVCYNFTSISFLWYNLIGCVLVLVVSASIQASLPRVARADSRRES